MLMGVARYNNSTTHGPVADVAFTHDGLLIAHIQLSSELWEWRVADGSVVHAPVRNIQISAFQFQHRCHKPRWSPTGAV